jgi:calcium binding protein 39
VLLADE